MNTKKEYIKKWCELALKEVKNINSSAPSSYGLKHYCENSIGVYVSNTEIIEVMKELGYKSRVYCKINHDYNISIIVNKIVFNKRLGNEYSNDYKSYHSRSLTINFEI